MDLQNQNTGSFATPMKVYFHGTTMEYFRIWIVNIALTIITLGIYSAWAKVRKNKYLYGNTELSGHRFDYHANPINILKGRILVAILFVGYSFGGHISVGVAGFFFLAAMLLFPWILVRAYSFSLANTSYRNIRFGFKPDYADSYTTSLKAGLITIFTLGLGFPYAIYCHANFRINRIRYGSSYFVFKSNVADFFSMYAKAWALFFLAILALVFFIFVGGPSMAAALPVLIMYPAAFYAYAYIGAKQKNLIAEHSQLEGIRFNSTLEPLELFWIYLTNLILAALTLGLAIPWGTIRLAKYRAQNTRVIASEAAIEQVRASQEAAIKDSASDAAVDFWDIDLGF